MDDAGKGFERLYRAADAFLSARPEGEINDELLEQHQEVRDLLEPMLRPVPVGGDEDEHTLGDFRLLREIGRGGMGVVYEAWQIPLNRRVALKVLPAHVTLRRESVARFHREAKTAAQLDHPGIVDIHAIGSEGETHFFAMEFIEGAPLDRVLARVRKARVGLETLHGGMLGEAVAATAVRSPSAGDRDDGNGAGDPWAPGWVENVVRLALQVAGALEHAHSAGVIHRDVKPSNILVREDGTAALTDFGLAREMGLPSLTRTGDFAGTPHYVSPEQVRESGRKVDQRSDVYALGATLYELLTLEVPFPGHSVQEVLDAIRSEDPVEPQKRNTRLAPDLAAIVLKALEKDPDRRYQSARALADDLQAFLDYRPVSARRTSVTTRLRRYGRRLARRHPALLAGAGVGAFALVAGALLFEGRGREIELEYSRLCVRAEDAMSRVLGRATPLQGERSLGRSLMWRELQRSGPVGESPRVFYDRAIELLPGRPEAWFGRALMPGRPLDDRLADLDGARARGLSPRTFHLARAYLLGARERWAEAEREKALAAEHPRGTPQDAYFEGMFQIAAGNNTQALELLTRAIEGSPRASSIRPRALRARVLLHHREGDPASALADLHVLFYQGQGGVWTCGWIARTWWRLGRREEAEHWFQKALRRAREEDTVSAWSDLCLPFRRLPWHIRATEEALAAHPDAADIVELRVAALMGERRLDEAVELCQRALDLHPAHAGLYQALAVTYVRMERYHEALEALDRAIDLDPAAVGFRRNRGCVLGFLGRSDDALREFHEAERMDPANPVTYVSRGALLANDLQRFEEALEQFDKAIAVGGRHVWMYLNRAIVLISLKRYPEALQATDQALAVAANDRERAEVMHQRGRALDCAKRPEEALSAFEEACRLDPDDVESRTQRGALLSNELGRHEEALAVFEEALALEPKRAVDWYNKAIALGNLKRFDEARKAMEEAVRLDPDDPEKRRWLARIFMNLGRFEDAVAAYGEASRLDPNDFESRGMRGVILHNKLRRYQDALDAFVETLALDSKHAGTWFNKALVLRSMQRYDDALAAIDEAIRLDGDNAEFHSWRGAFLHDELGRYEDALAAFEAALRLDPKHAENWRKKAALLRQLKRHGAALAAIGEAIRLDPDNPHLHVWRGELLNDCFERHQDALADFTRATELKPGLSRAHRDGGIALKGLEKYARAIEAFDRALAIEERDAYTHFMRGSCQYLLGDNEEAVKSLARSVEIDRSWAPAHSLLGSALMALGKDDEGLAALGRAIDLAPKNAMVRHDRGQALAHLGRHEKALEDFAIVVRLQPENANAHYDRGRSLHALRRYEQAVEAYDATLQHDRRHEECRRWRAIALRELQRFEQALRETERRLRRRPKDPWARDEHSFLLACLGRFGDIVEPEGEAGEPWVRALAIRGRFEDALRHARKLDDPHARVYCLRATGRADAARALACKATKGAIPKADRIRFAYLCAAAGEDEKARAALEAHDLPWHPFDMYERVRIHCLLGETEAALEWLGRAVDKGLRWPANMAPDPDLKPIAGEPRYRSLLERMHRRRLSPAAGEGKR